YNRRLMPAIKRFLVVGQSSWAERMLRTSAPSMLSVREFGHYLLRIAKPRLPINACPGGTTFGTLENCDGTRTVACSLRRWTRPFANGSREISTNARRGGNGSRN